MKMNLTYSSYQPTVPIFLYLNLRSPIHKSSDPINHACLVLILRELHIHIFFYWFPESCFNCKNINQRKVDGGNRIGRGKKKHTHKEQNGNKTSMSKSKQIYKNEDDGGRTDKMWFFASFCKPITLCHGEAMAGNAFDWPWNVHITSMVLSRCSCSSQFVSIFCFFCNMFAFATAMMVDFAGLFTGFMSKKNGRKLESDGEIPSIT
jgi:hypothetical protein